MEKGCAKNAVLSGWIIPDAGRQVFFHVMIVVGSQAELLQVVVALSTAGRLAHLLHRRDQEADQNGDDRDDDEQLDERKASPSVNYWQANHGFNLLRSQESGAKANDV